MGQRELKGFDELVQAYVVTQAATAGASTIAPPELEGAVLEVPIKPSIAVLPFANLSSDPEQAFFADGLVSDLIAGLFVLDLFL